VVTFVEQPAGLAVRYARRTVVLTGMLTAIGLALAGRAGARLAGRLGLAVDWGDLPVRSARRSRCCGRTPGGLDLAVGGVGVEVVHLVHRGRPDHRRARSGRAPLVERCLPQPGLQAVVDIPTGRSPSLPRWSPLAGSA
jgi:hypothetical protein